MKNLPIIILGFAVIVSGLTSFKLQSRIAKLETTIQYLDNQVVQMKIDAAVKKKNLKPRTGKMK